MFKKNTFFITILIASLALVSCKDVVELNDIQKTVENTKPEVVNTIELTDVQKAVENTNPAAVATLTQLRVKSSNSPDAINTYRCTVGYQPTGRLACTAHDSTNWAKPHDIELKLRCPKSGSGLTLSYAEVIYSVTSANVNCYVHEGAVGLGFIGITINAWNTLIFDYSARFYSY